MKILHVSDTHAYFPELKGGFDVVVHSGDWLPDKPGRLNMTWMEYQEKWIRMNIQTISDWLKGKPLLFVQGNHDFIDVDVQEKLLRAAGIDARHLHDRIVNHNGYNFYGMPYVNAIDGSWNHERTIPQLQVEIDKICKLVNKSEVDVIVAHAPPGGILDKARSGRRFGLSGMTAAFQYKFEQFPKAYLCGHIHENRGQFILADMIISNAATTQFIIEI